MAYDLCCRSMIVPFSFRTPLYSQHDIRQKTYIYMYTARRFRIRPDADLSIRTDVFTISIGRARSEALSEQTV